MLKPDEFYSSFTGEKIISKVMNFLPVNGYSLTEREGFEPYLNNYILIISGLTHLTYSLDVIDRV